jgi:hypothetical protein
LTTDRRARSFFFIFGLFFKNAISQRVQKNLNSQKSGAKLAVRELFWTRVLFPLT